MSNAYSSHVESHDFPGQDPARFEVVPQTATPTGYIGAIDAIRIVRRRFGLIALVTVLGLLVALIFLAVSPPTYVATTSVMVLPADQQVSTVPLVAPVVTPTATDETLIQTKVELLQSRSLARQVIEKLRLTEDPEFAGNTNKPPAGNIQGSVVPAEQQALAEALRQQQSEAVADQFANHVSVTRVNRSNVIAISASSTDPVKAARIANQLVGTYMKDQADDAAKDRQHSIDVLSVRVAEARRYLEQAESTAATYRREHGLLISQPESNGSSEASQLTGIEAQALAESAADRRKAAIPIMSDGTVASTSALLTELSQQESVLARKLAELSTFYGPGYPDLVQTSAELATVRSRIRNESSRLRMELANQAAASQAKSATIGGAIAGIRSKSFAEGRIAVPLRALERNVDAINTLYTTLLNQLNTKMGSSPDKPDLSLISPAVMPTAPNHPLPSRVLPITMIAALVCGMLLAFVIETTDTKLRTAEQVQRLLGIPTLAMIPELKRDHGLMHRMVAGRPRSPFSESMRNLLIELEARVTSDGGRVIVVTSPLEGEGKSTVASSLAAAAGVIGRNAVLVNFDLRRSPSGDVADIATESGVGVGTYLAKRAIVDDLVALEAEGHFAVIGPGEKVDDPGTLIASPQLPELVDQLRHRFELVILNAPPILPVRDAKTLADHADATLLVLRWGRTSPEAAAAALQVFDRPVIGAVLNRVDYKAHAARRYGDAIHHVSLSMAYLDAEQQPRNFGKRIKRWCSRSASRMSERLHLS